MNPLKDVAEFHSTFDHPVLPLPYIPDTTRCDLRVSLIKEELGEMVEAIKEVNIVEIADALCDLQYVISGAVLEFGLLEKFPELFAEVHRSNMSKACSSQSEAEETVQKSKAEGVDAKWVVKDDVYLVYRVADGKTIKSINYSPADLKSILDLE